MADQRKATLYGLAAVLLWSTVASAFKLSLRLLEPVQLLLYASIFSSLALFVIVAAKGRLGLLRRCTRRQLLASAGLGLLNPVLYYLVLFEAYRRLPAQEAQPLNYTWAITLALLSIPLLRQRPRATDLVATFVGYGGVLVIATRGQLSGLERGDPLGVALALASTVIWALYWIFNIRDERDPLVALLLGFLLSLPWLVVLCLLFSSPWLPSPSAWLGAAYVGLFEMGITFALWLTALRHAESAARVGNLIFLSPLISLGLIHLVVGEEIRWSTLAGLFLILAALMIQRLGGASRRR